MAALGHLYLQSIEFANLKESTQDKRHRMVEYIVRKYGHLPVAGATADDTRSIMMAHMDTPGKANNLKATLSVLFEFAILQEPAWRETNPAKRVPKLALGEHRAWTDDELARFEARWPLGTIQRTLYAILLYTGQRKSGVHPMCWEDISDEVIRVEKQKQRKMRGKGHGKSKYLWIPVHPRLREALNAWTKTGHHLFNSSKGTLYCSNMLYRLLRRAIEDAGLSSKCVAHGLRKSAARLLAEAGCSAREIMAITGHETLEQVEFYTEAVSQVALAKKAMAKFETIR